MRIEGLDRLYDGFDEDLTWRGKPIWKNPVDLMQYQAIAREVRPSVVIETGTHLGGSAEFWWDMMDRRGLVVTIDVDQRMNWFRDDLVALVGSSVDSKVVTQVASMIDPLDVVLVNLDSLHWGGHVLAELEAYSPFVTVGSYLIVEDGIDDFRHGTSGPYRTCTNWLKDNPEFVADRSREVEGWTNCPSGFLRRVS